MDRGASSTNCQKEQKLLIWEYLCFGLPAKNSLFAVVKGGYFTEIFFFLKKSKQSFHSDKAMADEGVNKAMVWFRVLCTIKNL